MRLATSREKPISGKSEFGQILKREKFDYPGAKS